MTSSVHSRDHTIMTSISVPTPPQTPDPGVGPPPMPRAVVAVLVSLWTLGAGDQGDEASPRMLNGAVRRHASRHGWESGAVASTAEEAREIEEREERLFAAGRAMKERKQRLLKQQASAERRIAFSSNAAPQDQEGVVQDSMGRKMPLLFGSQPPVPLAKSGAAGATGLAMTAVAVLATLAA